MGVHDAGAGQEGGVDLRASSQDLTKLAGYKEGGMNAKAYDVTGIDTRIRYDSSRTPPFTVMTSMPSKS
ncbi:hypothetical protein ACF05L_29970 [Streptomyces bobili]|uniref:hypothetical protein n=1 Tax=Streptomyces bobili TaxID=67280 RepID=UPI0036F5BE36